MTMAMFQAQLNTMVTWFDQWSESGQTVALFKMLTRLAPIQARFVAIALEHSLTECTELALREQEANNPGFVSGLLCEPRETGMSQAILHLPLLRPGNAEARHCYLTLISALLSYTVQTGCLVEEARQLLSYALIHPALKDDRKVFEQWRQSLGERIMLGNKAQALAAANELQQQKTRRSNSLTPPFAVTPNTEWTSQDDLSMHGGKVRRFSLSSEQSAGPPLSPQSSQASSGSGSETHLDADDNPAMRDVKAWLKSLRLHKYWRLFSQLTYEQMLSLNEDNFDLVVEQMGGAVTQGARRKIILSIAKLRDRANLLAALEQDVMSGGNLVTAMDEMKLILATPIKAYPEDELSPPPYDDIPTQFTRLLGKVCTQVMVSSCTDEEALSVFLSLLDSALHHDAFTSVQKKKISSWRLQVSQQIRQLGCDPRRGIVFSPPHRQLYPRPFAPRPTIPVSQQHLSPVNSPLLPPTPPQHLDLKQKTDLGDSEPEINSRLESLCLSMTEHALGSPSDNM